MAGVSDEAYCADTVRETDRDRWLAAVMAPAEARPGLIALYCLNAETARIPDQVSEPIVGHIRLQWWRDSLLAIRSGDAPVHPALRTLAPALASGALAEADISAFLDAREAELDEAPPRDLAEFEARCRGTGGALARMALGILSVGVPEALAAGEAVGTAHAMAGQLRNVSWLASRGRIGLPDDLLAAHGVSREALLSGRPGHGLARAAEEIAVRARELLAEARMHRPRVPGEALPVLLLARLSETEFRRMGRVGYDLFAARTEPLPITRMLAVLGGAFTKRY